MWTQNNYTRQTKTIENTNQNYDLMKQMISNASLAIAGLSIGHFLHFAPKLQQETLGHAFNNHCLMDVIKKSLHATACTCVKLFNVKHLRACCSALYIMVTKAYNFKNL